MLHCPLSYNNQILSLHNINRPLLDRNVAYSSTFTHLPPLLLTEFSAKMGADDVGTRSLKKAINQPLTKHYSGEKK